MATGQVPDWPDELDAAAEQRELGAMTCWNRVDIRSTNRVGAVTSLVAAAITLTMGTALAVNDQRVYGQWYNSAGVLAVGLLLLVLGLVLVVKRGEAAWVCLYDQGLVWQSTGKEPVAMRWTDVDQVVRSDVKVTTNGVGGVVHRNTFVHGGGAVIAVTSAFPAVEDLTERIIAATVPVLLASMAGRLDRGETVSFGPLSMDGRGLSHEHQRVAWSDVTEVRVRKSELQVLTARQRKPWVSVTAVGFPNLVVMLTLADALARAHRPSSV